MPSPFPDLYQKFADWLGNRNWIFKRRGREQGLVTLDRHRIFIPPTRHGMLFALLLLALLLGSINYNNSMGFAMTFLLSGMATVSIFHTYFNLAQLDVGKGKTGAVFAGQIAQFNVCLENKSNRSRYAVALQQGRQPPVFADIPAGGTVCLPLAVPAPERGMLRPGRFTLSTQFPLGLFRASSRLELDMSCLVYPAPEKEAPPLPLLPAGNSGGRERGAGEEDFAGLRGYHAGDSPRRVAWKATAGKEELLTKQFAGAAETSLWLDYDALAELPPEARLSRLCRWVLDAEAGGRSYGLQLPGLMLPPAKGELQQRKCLEALALFGLPPDRKAA